MNIIGDAVPEANKIYLPDEILLAIALHCAHRDLLALTRVSVAFHRWADPLIYRRVIYADGDEPQEHGGCGIPDGENYEQSGQWHVTSLPKRGSYIYDLDIFLTTITASEARRSSIVAASFCWESPKTSKLHATISQILDLIGKSLRYLHIGPPFYDHGLDESHHFTSLQFPSSETDHSILDRFSLHKIFVHPTLKRLVLDHLHSWWSWHDRPDLSLASTSDITHLSCPATEFYGPNLYEVLTWPRALKFLYLDPRSAPMDHDSYQFVVPMKRLARALWSQRETLETLIITGTCHAPEFTLATLGSLREFKKLTRLGVPREFLVIDDETLKHYVDGDDDDDGDGATPSNTLSLLPPNLRALQLGLCGLGDMSKYFADCTNELMTEKPGELSGWICELAVHKALQYPALKQVVVWKEKYGNIEYYADETSRCGRFPGMQKAVEKSEKAEIELSLICSTILTSLPLLSL